MLWSCLLLIHTTLTFNQLPTWNGCCWSHRQSSCWVLGSWSRCRSVTVLISWKCWTNRHGAGFFAPIKEPTLFVVVSVRKIFASWYQRASSLAVSCRWNIANQSNLIGWFQALLFMKVLKSNNNKKSVCCCNKQLWWEKYLTAFKMNFLTFS